jgi:nitroreductase
MDVFEALRARRSVSALTDQVPTRETVQCIIEAAVWAPNHHLTEPWRFHILAGEAREAMGDAIADALADDLDLGDPINVGEVKAARMKLRRAPVVIVVSQEGNPDPVVDRENYAACCCATQNLLLAAHAEGLAAKWRTGAMARYPAAREYLGLGDRDHIVAYVYLGYPAPSAPPDTRTREAPRINWLGWE